MRIGLPPQGATARRHAHDPEAARGRRPQQLAEASQPDRGLKAGGDAEWRPVKYPTPPSRRNRKALTTWQDDAAVKQLKDIANEHGLSQQALIAEGINYVLAKYKRPPVAT